MKSKILVFVLFLLVVIGIYIVTSYWQAPTSAIATDHLFTPETSEIDSTETLAEAMMQIYANGDNIDFKILSEGTEITFEFIDVESENIADLMIDVNDATSPNGVLRAFTACDIDLCQPRLFVESLVDSKIFEVIFSRRMPWRALNRLVWINDSVLAFSQWSNPHYGFMYAIDANQREYLLTLVLADECFTSGNCDS